jgi:two-component system NtrC family sensor kinase
MLNGTIKRKLVFGLVLVLCLSATMTASGIVGLISYRNVIQNLDNVLNVAPHKTELVEAVTGLFEPLAEFEPLRPAVEKVTVSDKVPFAKRQQVAHQQLKNFQTQLQIAKHQLDTFWRRTSNIDAPELISGRRAVTQQILTGMSKIFVELEASEDVLGTVNKHDSAVQVLRNAVSHLVLSANQLPDPSASLREELDNARAVYRRSWNVLISASVAGLLWFLLLIAYGYTSIFSPLRTLHAGASRVARGDFDFRVRLNTKDEMNELADAFNKMTTRFQETKADLDNQVRDRSKQLVRSERLAGVGFLAAGVAHEINNPLSAIQMAADSLQDRAEALERVMDPADAPVVQHYLKMIQRESDRCRQITSKLLDFARGQDATRVRYDVTGLIREVSDMVQLLSKHRNKKIIFDRPEACYLEINSAEIKQVILNLVANALESMEQEGRLEISLSEQTDQVIIAFRDDGCGMTQEVKDNLFEPFFTQKQAGQGTGLGLSISNRIIHEHGGTIEVVSDGPGQGSTFFVRIPRRAQVQGAAA